MSNKAIDWVYAAELPRGLKAVLLVHANHANGYMACWPSRKTIARKTSYKEDTVAKYEIELVARGLLIPVPWVSADGGDAGKGYFLGCVLEVFDEVPDVKLAFHSRINHKSGKGGRPREMRPDWWSGTRLGEGHRCTSCGLVCHGGESAALDDESERGEDADRALFSADSVHPPQGVPQYTPPGVPESTPPGVPQYTPLTLSSNSPLEVPTDSAHAEARAAAPAALAEPSEGDEPPAVAPSVAGAPPGAQLAAPDPLPPSLRVVNDTYTPPVTPFGEQPAGLAALWQQGRHEVSAGPAEPAGPDEPEKRSEESMVRALSTLDEATYIRLKRETKARLGPAEWVDCVAAMYEAAVQRCLIEQAA